MPSPPQSESPPQGDAGTSPRASSGQPTVLLVEDSPVAHEKISAILRDLGCSVVSAFDGVEGLRQAAAHGAGLHLVVLDIQMPRMDGITALRHLRQMAPLARVPIVMLTTQADKETVRTALGHKANDFIRKDSSIPAIAERLRQHLRHSKAGRSTTAAPRDPAQAAQLARAVMQQRRPADSVSEHPWALFYESRADIQDLVAGKNPPLAQFYATAAEVLQRLGRVYRGIEPGFGLEHERQAVTRLVSREEAPATMLLVSGRQSDGASLARMVRFSGARSLPVYLICESLQAVPVDQRDAMQKSGISLLERRQLGSEQLQSLFAAHLLPEFRVTESGLHFHELKKGFGPLAHPGQQASVHCTGTLTDGTVCLDTRADDQPLSFTVGRGQVVQALDEAVGLVNKGGQALLVAGPELAYGEAGDGEIVPPGATVVYNLELLDVGDAPASEQEDEAPPKWALEDGQEEDE